MLDPGADGLWQRFRFGTLIVYPGEQGMFLGELRLFFGGERRATRYFHRLVPLAAAVEEDRSLVEFQRRAEAEITAAKQK